jgi:eukaryotic-like serine/threonine-protein kinase
MGPSAESAAAAFRAGSLVGGHLKIEAEIAQGGAGAVYRVLDGRGGKRLALKRLQLSGGPHDALLAAQFQREYHTLCQLAHPRIIGVYDYGVEAGFAYYTMELLDGEDLHERGKLPFRTACALLRDVASSLAILHSRGLLHRDVSARNVRCTADGRAKLIDFGAMAPMGIVKQVVGTPPFIPPEALQLQALDGRADLYALGALAYFCLTGHHAYPARALGQLRELWRSAPPSPRELEPELPVALDRLVMELLSLERSARPRSAAEVMERLSGIAGLPLAELDEVAAAYLVMPTLVGRDAQLQEVRAALLRAAAGTGASFLISTSAGMGRSRFLDACVLEAKLQGAVVMRADPADRTRGDYSIAAALCEQMLAALPQLSEQAARPRRAILAHLIAGLGSPRPGGDAPERRHLQAALRDWILAVARDKPLVIAVDDFDAADEPSAALLGMLSHAAGRRRLVLLLTTRSDAAPTAALSLQHELSSPLVLQPLSASETEALLRSVFGEVEHVARLAARIHLLAEGSPQWTIALCEHLCERGVARYEAGSWRLPTELGPDALPESLAAAFVARIAALPPDARELCQVLALTDISALALPSYVALTSHRDPARVYSALDALEQHHILLPAGDRYRFSRPELCLALQAELPPEQLRNVHARIAAVVADCDQPMLLPHHLMLAGEERDAIERLRVLIEDVEPSRFMLGLLERAVLAAEQQQLSRQVRLELQVRLCRFACSLGERTTFLRYAEPVLERLKSDSGLADYHELDPALPAEQRLTAALAQAGQRHAATPPAERGFEVPTAIEQLVWLCDSFIRMASLAQELGMVERVPVLTPLFSVSPAIETFQSMVDLQMDLQSARFARAYQRSHALAERLQRPDHGGLRPKDAKWVRLEQLSLQGIYAAASGTFIAAELLGELEDVPGARANAWRVRMTYEYTQGNLEVSRAYQRRAELIRLQDGAIEILAMVRTELRLYIALEDLVGVKRTLERIEALATGYPGWRPTLAIARSQYHLLQGGPEAALAALAPALEQAAPGRHIDSGLVVGTRLAVLNAMGRHAEAVLHGRSYEAIAEREGLDCHSDVTRHYAAALARCGEAAAAVRAIESHLSNLAADRARGLYLGLAHEVRARIALEMRDEAALRHHANLCAHEYRRGTNPLMGARYEHLIREAMAAGFELAERPTRHRASVDRLRAAQVAETVYGRLLTCIGTQERAHEGLRILLDATGAATGHLFGLRAGKLQLLSSVEQFEESGELVVTLEDYLQRELEADATVTSTEAKQNDGLGASPLLRWVDALGREYEPLMLFGHHDGEHVVVAVAALHYENEERPVIRRDVLEALSRGLLADDVIDPVTCVS